MSNIIYTIKTKVTGIKDLTGVGLGWFVHFEGSHESLYFGEEKPEAQVGDTATIRISFNGRQ